jgi:hypothetical protein
MKIQVDALGTPNEMEETTSHDECSDEQTAVSAKAANCLSHTFVATNRKADSRLKNPFQIPEPSPIQSPRCIMFSCRWPTSGLSQTHAAIRRCRTITFDRFSLKHTRVMGSPFFWRIHTPAMCQTIDDSTPSIYTLLNLQH